jgi:hypothetical protein
MLYRASDLAGSCEHSNEYSGSIKDEKLFWLAEVLVAPQEGLCSME